MLHRKLDWWTFFAECGGALEGTSGTFSSPGAHRGGYNHSLNCLYTISNPNPRTSAIKLTVGHLDLERGCYDYIKIQGGEKTHYLCLSLSCRDVPDREIHILSARRHNEDWKLWIGQLIV